MEHLRTLRTNTKTFHNNDRTEDFQDQHGGETWFRVKETTKPPAPPLPKASTAASVSNTKGIGSQGKTGITGFQHPA